jgi:hypothetical protein
LYRANVNISCVPTFLKSFAFFTSGNYRTSDIDNFKIWFHTNPSFNTGTPILLSTKTTNLDTGYQNFASLNQLFPEGLGYIFITTDILCKAKQAQCTVKPISLTDIVFSTGNSSGTVFTSSTISYTELDLIDSISGPKINIYINTPYSYSVKNQSQTNYVWTISNGTIISGQGTNSISVQWDSTGQGKIFVEGTNQLLCSDTASLNASIFYSPNCILLSNGNAPITSPTIGTKNVVLYRINAIVSCVPTMLKSFNFTTSGTYSGTEIDSLKNSVTYR